MVKEIRNKEGKYYQCETCNMYYKKVEFANKCENWCNETKSCNMEIIKHAVKLERTKQ